MWRVLENMIMRRIRKIFGPKREEISGGWKKCRMRSFIIGPWHQILFQ
jgi:hypothetical protein